MNSRFGVRNEPLLMDGVTLSLSYLICVMGRSRASLKGLKTAHSPKHVDKGKLFPEAGVRAQVTWKSLNPDKTVCRQWPALAQLQRQCIPKSGQECWTSGAHEVRGGCPVTC